MKRIKAAIFDLDGVITDTAKVHFAAWQTLFNDFLKQQQPKQQKPLQPFTQEDYLRYVDGRPRLDGIRNFLVSRGIHIPINTSYEAEETITEEATLRLSELKNQIFHRILAKQGVKVFKSSIDFVKQLRAQDVKIAIVSSSKNCKSILAKAKIQALFDVKVDGIAIAETGLRGKPYPDMFLEAAHRLQVEPRQTLVVEDAISGVQAAQAGKFALIVGIDRGATEQVSFLCQGAHIVISDLSEINAKDIQAWLIKNKTYTDRDSALQNANTINKNLKKQLQHKQLVIFLDYDGTLTPIVARPELAKLSSQMRECLKVVSARYPTIVISGRMLSDLRDQIGIENIYYAGNHGFEIQGPNYHRIKQEFGKDFLDNIATVYKELACKLKPIAGMLIENKRFSLSIHYRQVKDKNPKDIETVIDTVLANYPNLSKHHGKKVFEIRPKLDWNKGKAVLYLLQAIKPQQENIMPIYIGDDVTDEDAFHALKDIGIGIRVAKKQQPTWADYSLQSVDEVKQFLENLL